MIRSSKHTLSFLNENKRNNLNILLSDYRVLVQSIIDYVWINGYKSLLINKNKLQCPSMIDSSLLKKFKSNYTERLKQCAGKQAMSMISAATEKRRKQFYQLKKLQLDNQNTKSLQRKIHIFPLIKPNASKINMELDFRFIDFEFSSKMFLGFVRISNAKSKQSIKIPICHSKVFDKWFDNNLKKSIRISEQDLVLYFDIKYPDKKINGNIVGCDQGIKDLVTLSDNQKVTLYQGKYNLTDIQNRLSRKTKGSKSFRKTQEFRKNYINWYVNQLNFNNIKELRIEKLLNVGKGKSKSRFLSHWAYTLINDKLFRVSEEKGFLFTEMPNEFRSQRCSVCSWVRKANRKGKTFCCKKCGNIMDADLNAATNLELNLYKIPYWVRLKKINAVGFYWKESGLYSESQELIVPDAEKNNFL